MRWGVWLYVVWRELIIQQQWRSWNWPAWLIRRNNSCYLRLLCEAKEVFKKNDSLCFKILDQWKVTNNHSKGYNFRLGINYVETPKTSKCLQIFESDQVLTIPISRKCCYGQQWNPIIKNIPNSKSALAVKVKKQSIGQSIIKTNRPNTDMSNDQWSSCWNLW